MGKKILGGTFQGGHNARFNTGKKAPTGYNGGGTRKYKWTGPMATGVVPGVTQEKGKPFAPEGRVIKPSKSGRTGMENA